MREAFCIRALELNMRDIGDNLTELKIYLPNGHAEMSPELESATIFYFSALDAFFKTKSTFEKVSVYIYTETAIYSGNVIVGYEDLIYEFTEKFLSEDVERRIMSMLSKLTIDFLDICFKIQNPYLLVNPSVRKISANHHFISSEVFPNLPNLNTIVFSGDYLDEYTGNNIVH
jgi:hypothetical protein